MKEYTYVDDLFLYLPFINVGKPGCREKEYQSMEKFNSYLANIDAGLIKEICTSRGRAVHFKKNEYFVRADEASPYIGFVVKGVFCYRCTNGAEGKTYNVGFAFSDEFIADYPACLYGLPSGLYWRTENTGMCCVAWHFFCA